jgi:hypothetical protein
MKKNLSTSTNKIYRNKSIMFSVKKIKHSSIKLEREHVSIMWKGKEKEEKEKKQKVIYLC